MAQPAFATVQARAEESALWRLGNARLTANAVAFNCLLAQEAHPMGLYGEMGELRTTLRLPRADMPVGMVRGTVVAWDTASYTLAELAAKNPAQFHVDAIEPYGAVGVRVWLR